MLKFNLDKKKINIYAYTYIYIHTYAHICLLACMYVYKHSFLPSRKPKWLSLSLNPTWIGKMIKSQGRAMAGDTSALGKTQTLLHRIWTDNTNTPPCPWDVFGSVFPPLTKESDIAGYFPSILPCFFGWPLRLGPLDNKLMKDSKKANSAALGRTKMQFFIPTRPLRSQRPHTSHS